MDRLRLAISADPAGRLTGVRCCGQCPLAIAGRAPVRCDVMSVEELQHAVAELPADELGRLSRWFEEFLADQWDRRIEADILAGRLDAAGRGADAEFEAGSCTPLPP
jgi:hypothetical protein